MTKFLLNRRRFLHGTALGAAALASPAYLRQGMAQTGGEVNIWTYNNFVPDDFKAQFESDTGIKVNIRLVDDVLAEFAAARQPA